MKEALEEELDRLSLDTGAGRRRDGDGERHRPDRAARQHAPADREPAQRARAPADRVHAVPGRGRSRPSRRGPTGWHPASGRSEMPSGSEPSSAALLVALLVYNGEEYVVPCLELVGAPPGPAPTEPTCWCSTTPAPPGVERPVPGSDHRPGILLLPVARATSASPAT